jgi:hypothetical protein
MHKNHHRSIKGIAVWVIVVLVTQLACGLSTSNRTPSPVPVTKAPVTTRAATQALVKSPTPQQQSGGGDTAEAPPPTEAPTQERASGNQPTKALVPTEKPVAEPLRVDTQGFGQEQQQVGYAFLVENPNPDVAIEMARYHVSAYDAGGAVVDTDSSYLGLILPGQKAGVAGILYLDEGISVTQIEVQVSGGDEQLTDMTMPFSAEQVTYHQGDYYSTALGLIVNPYNETKQDLQVAAVVYDRDGKIIGGGATYCNFVLAQGKTGVKVYVTSAGDVDHVEYYPSLSSLSYGFGWKDAPADAQELSVTKQGFGQEDTQVGYGALIQNPNGSYAVENSQYHINVFDANGMLLSTDEGYINTLLPSETLGVGGSTYLDQGQQAGRIDFQIASGSFTSSDPLAPFTADNINYQGDSYYPKVTGEINNPYPKDVSTVVVTAILYDDGGEIIGAGYTYLDFIPANDKAAVEVGVTASGTPAAIELYASLTSLSDYGP